MINLTIYLSHVVFVSLYYGFFAIIAENSHYKQAKRKFLTLRLVKFGKRLKLEKTYVEVYLISTVYIV